VAASQSSLINASSNQSTTRSFLSLKLALVQFLVGVALISVATSTYKSLLLIQLAQVFKRLFHVGHHRATLPAAAIAVGQ